MPFEGIHFYYLQYNFVFVLFVVICIKSLSAHGLWSPLLGHGGYINEFTGKLTLANLANVSRITRWSSRKMPNTHSVFYEVNRHRLTETNDQSNVHRPVKLH